MEYQKMTKWIIPLTKSKENCEKVTECQNPPK